MGDNRKLFIGLLVTALTIIVTAIVTPFGAYLKNMIFPDKYVYEGCIKNAGKPLKVTIVMDKKDSSTTDAAGKFIFDGLKKGKHEYIVCFNNQPYLFRFVAADKQKIDGDTYDLADLFVADSVVTTEAKTLASNTPTPAAPAVDTAHKTPAVEPPPTQQQVQTQAQQQTPPQQQVVHTLTAQQLTAVHAAVKPVTFTVADVPPDAILEDLTLKVSKSTKMNGKQIEYRYYLDGASRYLDLIKEVHYVRNHKTFPENANNTFIAGNIRTQNFDFKAFQWGYITTTYVTIILNNGRASQQTLKTITYVN